MRQLGRGQVERGRQVDDDRVDALDLEHLDDVVGGVEHLRGACVGLISDVAADRLVVPICTPMLALLKAASDVAWA